MNMSPIIRITNGRDTFRMYQFMQTETEVPSRTPKTTLTDVGIRMGIVITLEEAITNFTGN